MKLQVAKKKGWRIPKRFSRDKYTKDKYEFRTRDKVVVAFFAVLLFMFDLWLTGRGVSRFSQSEAVGHIDLMLLGSLH